MNYYETLFIVHPALESGHLKDIVLSVEESLKNTGGQTLSIDLWGKKRLAYLIEKQKYGTYIQLQFTGEGNCTSNFGMELEHNPNILAYLTTSINKLDVVEQEQNLDSQIAGQSRDSAQPVQTNSSDTAEATSEKNDEDAAAEATSEKNNEDAAAEAASEENNQE